MKVKHILPLLLLLLSGCGTEKSVSSDASASGQAVPQFDKEQVWQLVGINGKELSSRSVETILMFHPESGTLRGRVACNRYFADYTVRPAKSSGKAGNTGEYTMTVQYVSGGDIQCPEGDMAMQNNYLSLLAKADACQLTPYTLTLFRRGKEVLKFELQ